MSYYIYGRTDKGNIRRNNEDSVLIDHEVFNEDSFSSIVNPPMLTAVCDGVGGEKAGEIASNFCLLQLSVIDYSSQTDIDKILISVHNKIKRKGVTLNGAENMQTTLCCLAVDESGNALCINVGDSRMYRYTDGDIRQISTDHSLAQFLFDKGEIDKFADVTPQMRSTIISSMGSCQQPPKIDHIPFVTRLGRDNDTDIVIICSDGISDYVSIDEIEIVLSIEISFDEKIDTLIELAMKNGSTDNLSAVGIIPAQQYERDRKILEQIKLEKEEIRHAVEMVEGEKSDIEKLAESELDEISRFIDSLGDL